MEKPPPPLAGGRPPPKTRHAECGAKPPGEISRNTRRWNLAEGASLFAGNPHPLLIVVAVVNI
jgi:hypothetical protein